MYRRKPVRSPLSERSAALQHDRLAGERLLGADDERARLGGLDRGGSDARREERRWAPSNPSGLFSGD